MRLATVRTERGERLHVHRGSGYVDVATGLGDERFATLAAVLEDWGRVRDAIGALDGSGVEVAEADLCAAVPSPNRILCLGMNYRAHALEGGRDAPPTWPEIFVRGTDSALAPYGDLVRPALTDNFDFEGELGVVIGTGGRYIPAAKRTRRGRRLRRPQRRDGTRVAACRVTVDCRQELRPDDADRARAGDG